MTRRACLVRTALLGSAAATLFADSADEVWERLSAMASDLSEAHTDQFLSAFDPAMPGYQDLRRDVTALVAQFEVQSSIEIASNDGDDRRRTLEVDWLLRLTGHDAVSGSANREERVKAGFEKQGKRWRIVSFSPSGFFAPPRTR